ncbi:hypothetical protein [Paenibacillus sp. FSL K6-2393]
MAYKHLYYSYKGLDAKASVTAVLTTILFKGIYIQAFGRERS